MISPFKFLDSYTKDDRNIFFGREREIEELYQKVFESKIMLVYGVSGTGKSSLIHCGLANKFQDSDWLPINIRRGGDMVKSMAFAIGQAAITKMEGETVSPAHYKKSVRSLYLDHYKPIFFIFDQFEELFIFGNKEEKREFIQVIKALSESDLQCRFIFVLREEYLAGVTEFENVIPSILSNRVRIEKMTFANAKQVIEGPCKVFNIEVEEGFSDEMLEKLSPESTEVELTYLQVYLDKVYRTATTNPVIASEERSKQSKPSQTTKGEEIASSRQEKLTRLAMTFSKKILRELGEVKDLLGSFLDEQIELLPDPDSALAVLKSFVSVKGTKRQMSLEEVQDYAKTLGKPISETALQELLQTLIQLRILRDKDQNNRYELRHDALATKIYEKISVEEIELLEVKQFIENALLNYKKREITLSPEDLIYINRHENQLKLSNELSEFVFMSKENIRTKTRIIKRLTLLSAVALVILLFSIGKIIYDKTQLSQSTILAYNSIIQYKDIEQRLATAGLAYKKSKNTRSSEALIKAFNDLLKMPTNNSLLDSIRSIYQVNFEPTSDPIIHAEITQTTNSIFGFTPNHVIIWDSLGNQKHRFMHGKYEVLNAKISKDERFIAILSKDSLLTLYQSNGKKVFSRKIYFTKLNSKQAYAFTLQNKLLTNYQNDIIIIDTLGNIKQTLSGHADKLTALTLSKSNKFIASASIDTTVIIWYFNNVRKRYSIYNTIDMQKEPIWSVNFSHNDMYVITTAKKKYGQIHSINGVNSVNFPHNPFVYNIDSAKSLFYAEFSDNNFGVIGKSFNDTSQFKICYIGDYWKKDRFKIPIKSLDKTEFQYLSFSPCSEYFSYSIDGYVYFSSIKTRVFESGGHLLFKAKGEKQFFSKNGDYIYAIRSNSIYRFTVSSELIFNIISKADIL